MSKWDTKRIGNITELEVQTYMTKLDVLVSIPYGDRARYDQIWDVNGRLLRVQIKYAHEYNNGTIGITCSSGVKRNGKLVRLQYTPEEIDGIATFYKGRVYYIPVSKIPLKVMSLRFEKTLSNMKSLVNWASDYEVEKQLNIQMESESERPLTRS